MTHPLPASFNIVAALSGNWSRQPSNSPAAALWLYKPSLWKPSPGEREALMQEYLEFLYSHFHPDLVAIWRAEAAGLSPLEALALFGSHLDDWIPSHLLIG